jgi:hypothetical protein
MWNRQPESSHEGSVGQRPPGVIDTIGIGFETIVSRPLLILPPVLLDLYFWLGIHITSRPLVSQIADWFQGIDSTRQESISALERRAPENISELAAFWAPTLRVPTFMSTLSSEATYRLDDWKPALSLSWWGILLAGAALLLIGLLVGAEYLLAIAAAVKQGESPVPRKPGTGVLRGAVNLACWYAAVAGIALLALWPLVAGIVGAEVSGSGSSIWLIIMLVLPVSWAFVLFFFSIQAMFLDGTGPFAALRSSFRVVRGDSWSSLGVIIAYFLLTVAFAQVWSLLISHPVGLVAAMVGHAAIATGMIAATMVFYRDRAHLYAVAGHTQKG